MLSRAFLPGRKYCFFSWPKDHPIPNRSINQSRPRLQNATAKAPHEATVQTTNVPKDVLLYTHPNDRFFKHMTIFGAVQMIFWTRMAFVSNNTYKRREKLRQQCLAEGREMPPFLPPFDPNSQKWYTPFIRLMNLFGTFSEKFAYPLAFTYLIVGKWKKSVLSTQSINQSINQVMSQSIAYRFI